MIKDFKQLFKLILPSSITQAIPKSNELTISKVELKSYMMKESNGLRKKIEKGPISIEVIYKPLDFIIDQELGGKVYSQRQIESIRNELKGLDYFILKIAAEGKEMIGNYAVDQGLFTRTLNYLSFQIGQDIALVSKYDTIPVHDFMYFRRHGVNHASEILLVFRSRLIAREGSFRLLYKDDFFQTGLNEFEFETQSIRDIPNLHFTKLPCLLQD